MYKDKITTKLASASNGWKADENEKQNRRGNVYSN